MPPVSSPARSSKCSFVMPYRSLGREASPPSSLVAFASRRGRFVTWQGLPSHSLGFIGPCFNRFSILSSHCRSTFAHSASVIFGAPRLMTCFPDNSFAKAPQERAGIRGQTRPIQTTWGAMDAASTPSCPPDPRNRRQAAAATAHLTKLAVNELQTIAPLQNYSARQRKIAWLRLSVALQARGLP